MTNLEKLALAFPLHFQRIVELSWQSNGTAWLECKSGDRPAEILAGCFLFRSTDEGQDYWQSLAHDYCGHPYP